LESGANWADVTILGLGERSGCAHLEEVAGYLSLMRSDALRAQYLKPLAGYVAMITRRVIEACRPVIGERIFACETGLHLQGLYRDPRTYEPYSPELVGTRRHLLTGPKCGRNALKARLSILGVEIDDDLLLKKLHVFRNDPLFTGRTLSDDDFLNTMLSS
jgi:homocitrate synthase NifV